MIVLCGNFRVNFKTGDMSASSSIPPLFSSVDTWLLIFYRDAINAGAL